MSQVLDFRSLTKPENVRLVVVQRGDEMDEFWPEVSRRDPAEEVTEVDSSNSPKQVLLEVLALFSVVALLILAVTIFVPGP